MQISFLTETLLNRPENLLHILLEPEFEHLIGLIEYHALKLAEVDVAPLYVIEDAPSCADEELDAVPELADLVVDVYTPVNGDNFVLVVGVLQTGQHIGDLECELTSWREHDGLDLASTQKAVLSQVLDNG